MTKHTLSKYVILNSIRNAQRHNPEGARLEAVLKTAAEEYNATVDPDVLLNAIRGLYRAGRVLHARDRENQNLFRIPERLAGLNWMGIRDNTGMFLDVREKRWNTKRSPIVGWLNYRNGRYSVRIVSDNFRLTQPIPVRIKNTDDAVYWVLYYGEWVKGEKDE